MEQELADTNESLSDQTCTNQAICGAKMKCEQEMGSMSHDLDEMTAEAHLSEEKAQRAMIDAVRLAGELLRNSDRHTEVFQPLIIILQTLICHYTLQILQKKNYGNNFANDLAQQLAKCAKKVLQLAKIMIQTENLHICF